MRTPFWLFIPMAWIWSDPWVKSSLCASQRRRRERLVNRNIAWSAVCTAIVLHLTIFKH